MRSFIYACVLLGLFVPSTQAAPDWWAEFGATNAQPADDYAAANLGQLKYMAAKSAAALNSRTVAGAGAQINGLIATWDTAPGSGVVRDDYAAVTAGQLKSVSKLFYQRLSVIGQDPGLPAQPYPWSGSSSPADDWAMINIGQLKYVFGFNITAHSWTGDGDHDFMGDSWESAHLGGTSATAAGNADGDALSNLAEYILFQLSANSNPAGTAITSTPAVIGLVVYSP